AKAARTKASSSGRSGEPAPASARHSAGPGTRRDSVRAAGGSITMDSWCDHAGARWRHAYWTVRRRPAAKSIAAAAGRYFLNWIRWLSAPEAGRSAPTIDLRAAGRLTGH